MSNRVFRGFTEDSSSDYLKTQVNRNTISVTRNTGKKCYNFQLCSTATIQNYNTMRNFETFYNDKTEDADGTYYFNGEMNQANFLQSNINSEKIIITQLWKDLSNNMQIVSHPSAPLLGSTAIDDAGYNLFHVDPSGILDVSCSNLFFTQNNDVSYTLQNSINGITPRFNITNKLPNTNPICNPGIIYYPFSPVGGYNEGNDKYLTLGGTTDQINHPEVVTAVEKLNKLVGQQNYYIIDIYGTRTVVHTLGTVTPYPGNGYVTPSDKTPDTLLNSLFGENLFSLRTTNQYQYVFTENAENMYRLNGLLACLE